MASERTRLWDLRNGRKRMLLGVCELVFYGNVGGIWVRGGDSTYEAIFGVEVSQLWNRGSYRILKP